MSEPTGRRRLRRDTLDELLWTLRGRRGWLVGLGINLALGVAYALYTAFNANDHFFIRSASGVAANVALFVLSDSITTNQLGADRDHVVAGLRNGENVARILFTKNVALVIILLPLTMAISTGLRLLLGEDRTILSAIVLDIWIVLGWLALGNLASVLAPYWPMPLKRRWQHRETWVWWEIATPARTNNSQCDMTPPSGEATPSPVVLGMGSKFSTTCRIARQMRTAIRF